MISSANGEYLRLSEKVNGPAITTIDIISVDVGSSSNSICSSGNSNRRVTFTISGSS